MKDSDSLADTVIMRCSLVAGLGPLSLFLNRPQIVGMDMMMMIQINGLRTLPKKKSANSIARPRIQIQWLIAVGPVGLGNYLVLFSVDKEIGQTPRAIIKL